MAAPKSMRGCSRFWIRISGDSSSRQLLPEVYSREIKSLLPTYIWVETGEGACRQMRVDEGEGYVYISKGWSDFCGMHGLVPFDLVVFSYDNVQSLNAALLVGGGVEHAVNRAGLESLSPCGGNRNTKHLTHIDVMHGRRRFWTYLTSTARSLLLLPDVYRSEVLDLLPMVISLKTGDGDILDVLIEDINGCAYITRGWLAFVAYHRLQSSTVLVFSYDLPYRLRVAIFRPDGSEDQLNRTIDAGRLVSNEESTTSSLHAGKGPLLLTGNAPEDFNLQKWLSGRRAGPSRIEGFGCNDSTITACANSSDDSAEVLIPDRTNIADHFSCQVTLAEGSVQYPYVMEMPSDFVLRFLEIGYHDLRFIVGGRRMWKVNCKLNMGICRLVSGWAKFAQDNYLQVGDTLLFTSKSEDVRVIHVEFIC